MAVQKLTANQVRKIEAIEGYQKVVTHARALVGELEGNRAAKQSYLNNISSMIAREMQQMRQRMLTSPIGTVGDLAGNLAVMAGRSSGLQVKLRGLNDGLNSIDMQLDVALKAAMQPEKEKEEDKPAGTPPAAQG